MKRHLSTTALSKKFGTSSRELFDEFEKLGWITAERNLTVEGFSVGGIYKEITKDNETIKYIAWPENITLGVTPQDTTLISSTALGEKFALPALQINHLLAEIGWIKKGNLNKGWVTTNHGIVIGATQTEDIKSGIPYVRWPASIITHPTLTATINDFKGKPENKIASPDIVAFRERFPCKYRATDGHLTRSKAEAIIDNWLYIFEIAHAYERKLPIDEEAYSSFYIPHGKVYIEYFGCESDDSFGYDKQCERRKQEKLALYKKHGLNLIEVHHKEIENLDNILPKMLLKFGVQTI